MFSEWMPMAPPAMLPSWVWGLKCYRTYPTPKVTDSSDTESGSLKQHKLLLLPGEVTATICHLHPVVLGAGEVSPSFPHITPLGLSMPGWRVHGMDNLAL